MFGSNRTTNEENYLLQKFARVVLQTNNIDHHRTADFPAFAAAMSGKPEATATMRDVSSAPAILLIGNDPTEQHPLLAYQIRNNVRLHRAKLYVVNSREIKLTRQAAGFLQIPAGDGGAVCCVSGGDDSAAEGLGSGSAGESPATTQAATQANQTTPTAFRDQLRGEQRSGCHFRI